ncbi:MAG: proline--tRNA ligase [Thermodesulfobacteriota bacterium]
MRFSRILLPTLKESPADAEVMSQRLMVRAGMIKKVAAGIYQILPLGLRVLRKVENIVREEMDRAGATEVSLPVVIPSELWKESGRWDKYGPELLRVTDRHKRDFCIGPTHEEVITDMVRGSVRSYRQLPINLYQIQTKFRDEIRPRFGLMRAREFVMKDAYSFHADEESAEAEYRNMLGAYSRIFERCGLEFRAVEAESGAIGGSFSHEFMVLADTGEDEVAACDTCDYAANVERAEVRPPAQRRPVSPEEDAGALKPVGTPGKKTVEEVSEFLKVSPSTLIKTLIYSTDKGPVAALVRGDLELNEMKLARLLELSVVCLADDETVTKVTGAPSGFAGPVGLKVPIYADYSVLSICGAVTGGNEADTHLQNVAAGRDFEAVYSDLAFASEGDGCPRCAGVLNMRRGIEVGHVFKLGTKYSDAMGATFLDSNGKEQPIIMGCYGIGIGRTAAASIEQNHDEAGIIWPLGLAPFAVEVLVIKVKDEASMSAAEGIYNGLTEAGVETLFDERNERAGKKFKDADLIGIPVRITVGERNLAEGLVEVKSRGTGEVKKVRVEEAVSEVQGLLEELGG